MSRALSNVVAGLIVAIAVAGALSTLVWWARGQVSKMPSRVAEGATVATYMVGGDLVAVNYGYRQYTARLINEDGSVCGNPQAVQLPPRSAAVIATPCSVGWIEVDGNLLRVVRVGR